MIANPFHRPGLGTRLARVVVTVLLLLVVLVPIYWMMAASLKSSQEITQDATLYPHAPSFDNYRHLFSERGSGAFLTPSIAVTAISVALALTAGSLAAYAIARFHLRFRLERVVGLSLLTLRIVPPVVILIPVYLLMLSLNLLNTWLGLIITYTALNITFCVWMMESFFREIPVDLEEAAMVDGDSRLTAFRRITLPLAAPGLAATAIFAVIVTFNEFLFALVLTATPAAMTMPRGTATLIGHIDTDWASMSAAGVVGALPIVIFALLVQRHLVRGLTMGAVK
jgi:multiple sugar transport system permease protein